LPENAKEYPDKKNAYDLFDIKKSDLRNPNEEEINKKIRKSFLRLSLVIHPDRNANDKDKATKAFQILKDIRDKLSPFKKFEGEEREIILENLLFAFKFLLGNKTLFMCIFFLNIHSIYVKKFICPYSYEIIDIFKELKESLEETEFKVETKTFLFEMFELLIQFTYSKNLDLKSKIFMFCLSIVSFPLDRLLYIIIITYPLYIFIMLLITKNELFFPWLQNFTIFLLIINDFSFNYK
jgi:hypothetical protein